jgi:hypothetical protein
MTKSGAEGRAVPAGWTRAPGARGAGPSAPSANRKSSAAGSEDDDESDSWSVSRSVCVSCGHVGRGIVCARSRKEARRE